jgi:restriction system protein
MKIPSYEDLFNPQLLALRQLGGSGNTREIEQKVIELMKLDDTAINEVHRENTTKLSYRLAWGRTYLKRAELLENSAKGIWRLTQKGLKTKKVNASEIHRINREIKLSGADPLKITDEDADWRQELLSNIRKMSPSGFEYLSQRLLRESGFEKVVVTGKTGDGGIDGKGIMRLGGLLSFHVVFQCKRYSGSVPSKSIRDFRGAMSGRSEKGLFITTGRFTSDAIAEAQREGAIPIDLIDGQQLTDLMHSLRIGVTTK